MKRLTHERSSGIKTGYWSPNKKDELVERLAAYENTGLDPEEIKNLKNSRWIPVEKEQPKNEDYILVSFENYPFSSIARYEEDEEGGAFYPGDDDRSYVSYGLFVNAWMPLPENYKGEDA